MNEAAKKWIKALRSGEFTQTRKNLSVVDQNGTVSFCCLGVACDLLNPHGWEKGALTRSAEDGRTVLSRAFDGLTGSLPHSVESRYGLRECHGVFYVTPEEATEFGLMPESWNRFPDVKIKTSLVALNDSGRFTFDQLADIIERFEDRIFISKGSEGDMA